MELLTASRQLHLLPGRLGPRPQATVKLPFRQTEQFPPLEMIERLFDRCVRIPGVRIRQSRFAAAQSRALYLADPSPASPPDAFIDGREFCHLHAPPEGSVHLTLPSSVVEQLIALGWILRHPIGELGVSQNLVMAFGPRNAVEVDVVFNLVEHSCRFARGLGVPVGPPTHALVQEATRQPYLPGQSAPYWRRLER